MLEKERIILTDFIYVLSVKEHLGYIISTNPKMNERHTAYLRNNLQGEEKDDKADIEQMKHAIIDVLKHHDEPISWACLISNIQGSDNVYEALCELLHEKKIKRIWLPGRNARKAFCLWDKDYQKI
jgi:hypothetical protein